MLPALVGLLAACTPLTGAYSIRYRDQREASAQTLVLLETRARDCGLLGDVKRACLVQFGDVFPAYWKVGAGGRVTVSLECATSNWRGFVFTNPENAVYVDDSALVAVEQRVVLARTGDAEAAACEPAAE